MDDTAPDPGAPEYDEGPRYRPGRGGYDPRAAAAAARRTYVFRQRMVLGLILLAVASALVAGGLSLTPAWFVHAGIDLCLIGYLAHLRRQVRLEDAIRSRRAARMTGAGRYTDEPGTERVLDRRGRRRSTVADAVAARDTEFRRAGADAEYADADDAPDSDPAGDADEDLDADLGADRPTPEEVSALPRLRPVPPPERPFGTVVLELDDEDPELHDLEDLTHRGYRRAAGQ